MRLIDADALIALIPDASADIFENCRNCTCLDSEQIVELINKTPTVTLTLLKEQKLKPIEYKTCVDAMLKMWMENILTDGEYNKIMDKLNKAHKEGRI